MTHSYTIRSQVKPFPLDWLTRLRTCVFSIPLLIVSCGTAPQPALNEPLGSSTIQEITHPQAYYHFLRGSLAELNNDGS